MTQLRNTRDWLVAIHCSNHRTELAFKTSFQDSALKIVEETYIGIYFLHTNSGKLNSAVQAACVALGIKNHRKLPKIHGTRFINHRRRGFRVFLEIWPGLITAYENAVADPKTVNLTKAKLRGFLRRLKSYEFLCKTVYFLDILDASGPASLIFEGDGLMGYEIEDVTSRTCSELEDIEQNAGKDEEALDSNKAFLTSMKMEMWLEIF